MSDNFAGCYVWGRFQYQAYPCLAIHGSATICVSFFNGTDLDWLKAKSKCEVDGGRLAHVGNYSAESGVITTALRERAKAGGIDTVYACERKCSTNWPIETYQYVTWIASVTSSILTPKCATPLASHSRRYNRWIIKHSTRSFIYPNITLRR
ncbi:hypothetical protein DPMN_092631 [Dreissena polymorpha]|uniref:C-type lectin domain-containing protein n=1 Tax=Dreissena polymorpha TaxID=45954 RepID=A0A9D4L2R0_DREPO|nr:hypothetical protein DPMN_092631 [Dreissena polymorpha]